MIWVQHDFYKNFIESFNSEDIDLALDIFRSELSEILTYKSDKLFELFKKLKIKYNKSQSYEELLNTVLREIKKNKKFVAGLSFLIGENNDVVKNHKKIKWQKLLDGITFGIVRIAEYFEKNPRNEMLFKKRMLDMVGLKSSIKGDDKREIKEKDNTVLWIIGLVAVGVAGYFVWRYFDKKKQDRLRAESLNPTLPKLDSGGSINSGVTGAEQISNPSVAMPIDPEYTVPSDVLLPETPHPLSSAPAPPAIANTGGSVQINVSTPTTPASINQI
jgi:hypothetical protein